MATRTPLMAMTAVQALCNTAKRIPDPFSSLRREETESVPDETAIACSEDGSVVTGSGTALSLTEALAGEQ